jgi:hypothetical protein
MKIELALCARFAISGLGIVLVPCLQAGRASDDRILSCLLM